ncbi:MAG: toll/interleukin-1 receptor domain-containing protein [Dehalococcoidia bacterium]
MAEQPAAITPYVFLSYASAERVRAAEIADALERAGVKVWLDRESIPGGTSWGSEIVEGIQHCAALVICCTAAALQSRNVRQEIQLAWRFERAYLPLLLEPVQFPQHVLYFLEGWQWVEVGDVWWEQIDGRSRRMVPQNGAAILYIGFVDFDSLGGIDLQAMDALFTTTPLVDNSAAGNQLAAGTVFAVRTRGGSYAKVLVESYGYDLRIRWITYAAE